ncbi:MAG: sugar transferase [Phycisphaerae bacterium]|nr:sugar transferase [Phycisphaerae bacterium]
MNPLSTTFVRIFDILAIAMASPLILVISALIAIAIRITSGPPVLFTQERAGMNLKPFNLYKFRTMRTDIDPYGPSPKNGDDPRLTKIGKFLRLTSLDELPQLWHVLEGSMTLVGPRPLYVSQAREWNDRQKKRLSVKPGLTGLAQISGRGSLTIEDKLELDVRYVENRSLIFNARILVATLFKVLRPKDIYEKKYSREQDTRG